MVLIEILVGGFAGFVGAVLKEYALEPYRNYRDLKRQIAIDTQTYRNMITNPGQNNPDRRSEAKYALRNDAAELRALLVTTPGWALRIFRLDKQDIDEARGSLFFLSNNLVNGDPVTNSNRLDDVENRLGIDP